jgi:hypothetical protein
MLAPSTTAYRVAPPSSAGANRSQAPRQMTSATVAVETEARIFLIARERSRRGAAGLSSIRRTY